MAIAIGILRALLVQRASRATAELDRGKAVVQASEDRRLQTEKSKAEAVVTRDALVAERAALREAAKKPARANAGSSPSPSPTNPTTSEPSESTRLIELDQAMLTAAEREGRNPDADAEWEHVLDELAQLMDHQQDRRSSAVLH